jgi:hypothetical protein
MLWFTISFVTIGRRVASALVNPLGQMRPKGDAKDGRASLSEGVPFRESFRALAYNLQRISVG